MKRTFILVHDQARQGAAKAVNDAPEGWAVTISESNRSLEQNAAQWPILQAFADQIQWPVNGRMEWLEKALKVSERIYGKGSGVRIKAYMRVIWREEMCK